MIGTLAAVWRRFARPDAVRAELLDGRSARVRRRRAMIAVATFAAADALLVGLRQTGVLRRLPDLPLPGFDSNAVVTSRAAYLLGVPDAPVGAITFLLVAVAAARLADAGPGQRRLARLGLAGSTAAAAGGALFYLWDMLAKERRVCPYCLGTAASALALGALAMPDLRDGLRPRG